MKRGGLAVLAAVSMAGCTTGPVETNNPAPPSVYWTLQDQTTKATQTLTPAGSSLTAFITPGDDYLVVYHTASVSGIKSITFGGTGTAICHDNTGAYTERSPYGYAIPSATIELSVMPGNQAYTQGFFPYAFSWSNGPAQAAFSRCGSDTPLLGTTTFTGQSATESNVSSGASSLSVTTCAGGSCGQ